LEEPEFTLPVRFRVPAAPRSGTNPPRDKCASQARPAHPLTRSRICMCVHTVRAQVAIEAADVRTVADLKALFIDSYNTRYGLVRPPPRRPPCLAGSLPRRRRSLCPPPLVRPRCRAFAIPADDARPLTPARPRHAQPPKCVPLELGRGQLRARLVEKEAPPLRRGTHNKPALSDASPRTRARTHALTWSCRALPAPATMPCPPLSRFRILTPSFFLVLLLAPWLHSLPRPHLSQNIVALCKSSTDLFITKRKQDAPSPKPPPAARAEPASTASRQPAPAHASAAAPTPAASATKPGNAAAGRTAQDAAPSAKTPSPGVGRSGGGCATKSGATGGWSRPALPDMSPQPEVRQVQILKSQSHVACL
jgi:hypothetical protein